MRRTPFTAGWETRPNASFFAELTGGAPPWQPVTLPHDATLGRERGARARRGLGLHARRRLRVPDDAGRARRSGATGWCCWSSRASTARRRST